MPVPTVIGDLSTTAIANSPQGTDSAKGTIDDYFRAHASFIAQNRDNSLQVADYTALRAYVGPAASGYVTGYLVAAAPSGIAGLFTRDDADTTSADNGGTIIVATNGKRWKRAFSGEVNVQWFGAKCDGTANDWAAIQAAQEHLKVHGGGTLYFPGWCLINAPFYYYGGVTGFSPIAYPNPTQPKITWRSNGAGGIRSAITSGNVLQFSKAGADPLTYHVGFKDFVIDCLANNVIAVNGGGALAELGPNHYIDIDGLTIHGIEGPSSAIGVDFGSITDSTCRQLIVQGWNSGGYAGWRLNKTDIQLFECHSYYNKHGLVVGSLAEACIQMFGGSLQSCKEDCVYWESPVADSKASASVISGVFLGESNIGSKIFGALTPATLDIGSLTVIGCTMDNYRAGQDLAIFNWGGRFAFIGNNFYDGGAGGLASIDFGQYCYVTWLSNGMSIKSGCAALVLNQVNNFVGNASPSTAPFTPALSATGATFAYAASGQAGFYTKIGNLVTVVIRIELAGAGNIFSANAVSITGLPFPSSNGTFQTAAGHAVWANLTTPLVSMPAQISQNTSVIALSKITAASTSSFASLLANDLANSSVIEITMQYQV